MFVYLTDHAMMNDMKRMSLLELPTGDGSGGARTNVTFSAPFYTGVFLSSRELWNRYECHIEMVKQRMEAQLPWKWEGSQGKSIWNYSFSPDYFIGCDVNDEKILREYKVECGVKMFEIRQIRVKLFEFGFGSVSVVYSVSSNFSVNTLQHYDNKLKSSLSRIATKVVDTFKESVPCCVVNVDTRDIYNFQRVETSNLFDDGCNLQQVSAVIIVNRLENFQKINNFLKSQFFKFDDIPSNINLFCSYSFFGMHGSEGMIGLCMSSNIAESNSFALTVELLNVYLASAVYFDNFFHSYFDFVVSEYEMYERIEGDRSRWRNLFRLESLGEKFSDVLLIYSHTISLMQNQENCYSAQMEKYQIQKYFWENLPVRKTIDCAIQQIEEKIESLKSIHNQIDNAKNLYAIRGDEHASFVSTLASLLTFLVAIATFIVSIQIFDNNYIREFPSRHLIFIVICLPIIFILLFAWRSISHTAKEPKLLLWHIPRKLFHLEERERKQIKKMYKQRNKIKKKARHKKCKAPNCHRCSSSGWHCINFPCGISSEVTDKICSNCGTKCCCSRKENTCFNFTQPDEN